MKNQTKIIIATIFLTLAGVLIVLICVGNGTEYREALCVDGDGDVNLEGMMCEKSYPTFFGEEMKGLFPLWYILSLFTLLLIGAGFLIEAIE